MTFAEWFKANKKYIYGADVDAWCETAWDAGHAAGLQERAPVDMGPVAYLYTLEYGTTVVDTKVSVNQLNYPFGVVGSDYLRTNDNGTSYVRQTQLHTAAQLNNYGEQCYVEGQRNMRESAAQKVFSWNTAMTDRLGGEVRILPILDSLVATCSKLGFEQAVAAERLRWSTLLDLKEIDLKEAKRVLYQAREALDRVSVVDDDCDILHPSLADAVSDAITAIDKVLK